MQIVQWMTWLIQHHAELLADVLAVLVACTAVVHAMHGITMALGVLAKLTPGEGDDNAVRAIDGWLDKAEASLAWLQAWIPHLGVNRAKTALRQELARSSMPPAADFDAAADRVTKPDRPAAKR